MRTESFDHLHPHPDHEGVDRLYKFMAFPDAHPERINQILEGGLLHHSRPETFNDPWEAKPWVVLDEGPSAARRMRERLITSLVAEGVPRERAGRLSSQTLANRDSFCEALVSAVEEAFSNVYVCSLSSTKDSALLWSHYADSHRGLSIEFDATARPFSFAFKVHYQGDYPSVGYPMSLNEPFHVLSTKSDVWSYESEYRILYNPTSMPPGRYEGQCAVLDPSSMTAIYLGALMSEQHERYIQEAIAKGPFSPAVYKARLSRHQFSIEFERVE